MKCPKCGHELGEGNMYCEVCGEEIHIVPDFEPEIENSMSDVLNVVADEIDPTRVQDREQENVNKTDTDNATTKNVSIYNNGEVVVFSKKKFIAIVGVVAALVITLIAVFFIEMYKDNSASYQIEQGDRAFTKNKYVLAISYYEKAYRLDSDSSEGLYKIASCYERLENVEKLIDSYLTIIIKDPEDSKAYSLLADVLIEQEEYNELNDILISYAPEDIMIQYIDYIAKEPRFSLEDEVYDESMELEIIPASEGSVYYTLDGSEPGSDCELYTEPILLRKGDYIVNAIFVNEYGVISPMVSHKYTINSSMPDDPIISLDSGEYDKPETVTAVSPSGGYVYYTDNGTEPGLYSMIYSSPINIPLGESHYRFVAIDSEGNMSNIIDRDYNVNVQVNLTGQQALDICINRQIELGRILDANGTVEGAFGRMMYKLNELRYVNGHTVYFILEYYQEGNEFKNVDTIFAVDAFDGIVYHAISLDNDEYRLEQF